MEKIKLEFHSLRQFALALGVCVWMSACAANPQVRDDRDRTDAVEEVEYDLEDAAEEAGEDAGRARDEFAAGIRERMDKIDERIEGWEAELEAESREERAEARKQLNELRSRRDNLDRELNKLENASADAWQELKSDVDKAAKDVENFFEDLGDEFDNNN